jgi:hypothetical protein
MIMEFIHKFKGFNGMGVHSSVYIKVYYPADVDNNKVMVCFIDINDGVSVTNASEQLATEVLPLIRLIPEDCRFFETYQQYYYDDFDEIEYTWSENNGKWIANTPKWKPGSQEIKDLFELK